MSKVSGDTFDFPFNYAHALHEIWAEAGKSKQNHGNWSEQLRPWFYYGY
jgi:hypothetical protein